MMHESSKKGPVTTEPDSKHPQNGTLRQLRRSLWLFAGLGLVAGCTTGLGPRAIERERPDYNQQIVRSGDEQMLLNLVRLRYNDSPLFLELGSVVASYGYDFGLAAGGQVTPAPRTGNLGATMGYYEHPTVTYSPLTGDDFAERMLSPIPLDSIMLFAQSGWSVQRLLLVTALRFNDVFNAPTSTGPTPVRPPRYEPFLQLAEQLQTLQDAGLIGLNWERKAQETNAPGRDPHFWINPAPEGNATLQADVAAVKEALKLPSERDDFELTAFPFKRRANEVGIRCRSLLAVLYFLSTAVEPPPPHVQSGLVTVTRDEQGHPFDWSRLTGKVMTIHSSQEKPVGAAVAVEHRGWWFYIADTDQNSKITFNLLNILFALQSASSKGKSPVLTLPVN